MNELAEGFSALQPDYQAVLQSAQDTHHIEVTPLLELKGGSTGANLFLVSVSEDHSRKVQHLVLKLDHKSTKTRLDEIERHRMALNDAPKEFAHEHIPEPVYGRNEHGNAVAIFYNIAGHSLLHYKPLGLYKELSRIEKLFRVTNDMLLLKWNADEKNLLPV